MEAARVVGELLLVILVLHLVLVLLLLLKLAVMAAVKREVLGPSLSWLQDGVCEPGGFDPAAGVRAGVVKPTYPAYPTCSIRWLTWSRFQELASHSPWFLKVHHFCIDARNDAEGLLQGALKNGDRVKLVLVDDLSADPHISTPTEQPRRQRLLLS
jgi:hypothetical protein